MQAFRDAVYYLKSSDSQKLIKIRILQLIGRKGIFSLGLFVTSKVESFRGKMSVPEPGNIHFSKLNKSTATNGIWDAYPWLLDKNIIGENWAGAISAQKIQKKIEILILRFKLASFPDKKSRPFFRIWWNYILFNQIRLNK